MYEIEKREIFFWGAFGRFAKFCTCEMYLLYGILLRANSVKVEGLPTRDGAFIISGMATVGMKILVGVCWLHLQVSLDEAIPKVVDPHA